MVSFLVAPKLHKARLLGGRQIRQSHGKSVSLSLSPIGIPGTASHAALHLKAKSSDTALLHKAQLLGSVKVMESQCLFLSPCIAGTVSHGALHF